MLYTLIASIIIIALIIILKILNKNTYESFSYLSKDHTTIVKGIAALIIIIAHVANARGFSILNPLGGVAVSIFLISSGYGLNESFKKNRLNNFFKNRLLKIIIPYWLMLIFYYFINYNKFILKDCILVAFLINCLTYTWFIQYIMIWYL
ncbi:acyltransferase family protein, partial [Clostridium tarantellae]